MSIRSKLIFFMLTLLTAVSAVMAFLFLQNEWTSVSSTSQKKKLQILLAMSEVCREHSSSPGKTAAYKYFKTFMKTPELVEAYCLDANGADLFRDKYYIPQPSPFTRRFRTFPPPSTGVWKTRTENGAEIISAAIKGWDSRKRQVTAGVDFSTQLINQDIEDSLQQSSSLFFAILATAFALGATGTLIITRVIADPIQAMVEASRMIGSGRLTHRIPVTSKDEMGTLASEFNEMADKLAAFDELKKDFFSSVTHDLRSPVTGIELCSDIIQELARKGEYGKIPEQTVCISEHSQRLNSYIDTLLEVSRIESGKLALNLKSVNLEDLADRAVHAFKPYAAQKGLRLELVVTSEVPEIPGDPEKLFRVLSNLVGNAVKFTQAGRVSVFVEKEPGWQKLRISDTGQGIPASEIKNIFSKFYRVNRGRRGYPEARQGTGLGLFISKSIMEQHGGRIEAESVESKGSTFTVWLPCGGGKDGA